MKKVHVLEFVGRLKHTLTDQQQRVTWLLGAGCSVSSGIPTAGGMVRSWVRELHEMQGTRAGGFDDWVKAEFLNYTDEQAGRFYAKALSRRHPSPLERQRAIEMICAKARPGYGYATFAQIVSHERIGRLCNTILTTNFDDLVADALYLYGELDARPQVIAHEAVTHFARMSSPRPTVIKLHGDAHLDPKNTEIETKRLPEAVCRHLYPFLNDSALVFLGYSGGDESIAAFLGAQPAPALAPQIYWIGSKPPTSSSLTEWLAGRGALHVDHQDFDLLMHLLRGALEIPHPQFEARMKESAEEYNNRRITCEKDAGTVSDPEEKAALEKASKTTEASLSGVWAIINKAKRQEIVDPDAAEKLYKEALKIDDKNPAVLHNYAHFLGNMRKDLERAEALYKRAIEADPKNAILLNNYAHLVQTLAKDMDGAETLYKRAIEADPNYATALVNYAYLLQTVRKDMDAAEAHCKRAIEADPKYWPGRIAYAALCGARGDPANMRTQLNEVDLSATDPRFAARLHFLRYAHLAETRDDALRDLSRVLPKAEPSPYFNLAPSIERARADSHPHVPLLEELARVLRGEASIEVLDAHPAWLAERSKEMSNPLSKSAPKRRSRRSKTHKKAKKA